jgi:hypothetical protein
MILQAYDNRNVNQRRDLQENEVAYLVRRFASEALFYAQLLTTLGYSAFAVTICCIQGNLNMVEFIDKCFYIAFVYAMIDVGYKSVARRWLRTYIFQSFSYGILILQTLLNIMSIIQSVFFNAFLLVSSFAQAFLSVFAINNLLSFVSLVCLHVVSFEAVRALFNYFFRRRIAEQLIGFLCVPFSFFVYLSFSNLIGFFVFDSELRINVIKHLFHDSENKVLIVLAAMPYTILAMINVCQPTPVLRRRRGRINN